MEKKTYRGITPSWWKESVIYQVYPRSFKDSNGDGMGDLRGLLQKLDYLQALGVDTLWLCPIFKSPQDDNGYDVSDYRDMHAEFGSMEDFRELMDEMHRRGMYIVLDLVVNHTSDEHPWFIESRSSRDNPKRDWYIWRDGKDGKEPNNWESIFGGSAWKYDEKTDQYFMHLFSTRQPDLNWENREMRGEIYDMIRWWLDQGIDGFRIDAISHMKKEPGLPDLPNPENKAYVDAVPMHRNRPGVQEILLDLCEQTFRRYDIVTIGEANGVSAEEAPEWVAESERKLSMVIQFEHIGLWGDAAGAPLDLARLKSIFSRWQTRLDGVGWNALFVENHDIPRIVSKWGNTGRFWRESATSIAAMYFLMQGTPFIYQGQEIGMTNTRFDSIDDFNDVYAKNTFTERRAEGASDAEIIAEISRGARDNARTPMQWNAETQAGFTTGKSWLKVNPNYPQINADKQMQDPTSIWSFYRDMIRVRREHAIFVYGSCQLIAPEHAQVYAYARELEGRHSEVICNLSDKPARLHLPRARSAKTAVLKNYAEAPVPQGPGHELSLRPYECVVYLD